MKKWYFLTCVLVILGEYHLVYDDVEQRMLDTFSKANVGEIYNLSDFTNHSIYDFIGIDYIDFRYPADIEHNRENIVISYGQGKQKVIEYEFGEDNENSHNQVLLDADRRIIPFGYRCPLTAKVQLIHIKQESQLYDITPLNCQPLAE